MFFNSTIEAAPIGAKRWGQVGGCRFAVAALALAVGSAFGQTLTGPLVSPAPGAAAGQLAGVSAASLPAEAPLTLRDAVQSAILNNPEVLGRFHTIRAAVAERDSARGGLLPKADLSAGYGNERRNDAGSYARGFNSLSLTQLLYDGFATRNEIRRLDHAARVRLFELLETSESLALEAVRAYYDVVRYRELTRLAEDNFVEHRSVFVQTERRVRALVARAVDLQQITGRLALAEANLLIETSNLHDTTARFQRITGRLPPREMPLPPPISKDLPQDLVGALERAQTRNASLLAAIENVRASTAALATRKAAYGPRFDFRVKRDDGKNLSLPLGRTDVTTAEIMMNWNLFNGFSDVARERQFAEQLNVAKDLRDKTCRDIRQTLMIAFNDVAKLREQLEYLVQHEDAVSKALAAYRQQYDIGQRTLLDLLDTENELFQARRAVVNARHDLSIAYARTQAGMSSLLRALDLQSLSPEAEAELAKWTSQGDAAERCPTDIVPLYAANKEELLQRAIQAAKKPVITPQPNPTDVPSTTPGAAPLMPPAPAAPALPSTPPRSGSAQPVPGAAVAALTPSPSAAAPSAAPANGELQAVRLALENWRAAWAKRDVGAYLDAYAPSFAPPKGATREAWAERRRAIIGRSTNVSIDMADLKLAPAGTDRVEASFVQIYKSASYRDEVRKTLRWERISGRWMIVEEIAEPAAAPAPAAR